jgi:hypothetical protein
VSEGTQDTIMSQTIFAYRIVTFFDEPFQDSSANGLIDHSSPLKGDGPTTPPILLSKVWAVARSLATTSAISIDFCSSRYLDVSVPWVVSM